MEKLQAYQPIAERGTGQRHKTIEQIKKSDKLQKIKQCDNRKLIKAAKAAANLELA